MLYYCIRFLNTSYDKQHVKNPYVKHKNDSHHGFLKIQQTTYLI